MASKIMQSHADEMKKLGIDVSPEQARRYKQLIKHIDITKDYLQARIVPLDVDWWSTVVTDCKQEKVLEDEGLISKEIYQRGADSLSEVLSKNSDAEVATALANWMDEWVGPAGIKRIRNSINPAVRFRKKKRHSLSVTENTHEKFVTVYDKVPEAQSFDDMVEIMTIFFAKHHGINLEK